jgi:hypothetical protein
MIEEAKQETSKSTPLTTFRLLTVCLLFDPANEGDMFLRDDVISPNYTTLEPRRPPSSESLL